MTTEANHKLPFLACASPPADIASFYGLPADCLVPGALIARTTEARPKRLHYVSPSVKRLLQSDTRQALSVTAAGVKVRRAASGVLLGAGDASWRHAQQSWRHAQLSW